MSKPNPTEVASDRTFENFENSLAEFKDSIELTRQQKATRLASQIDLLSLSAQGISYLYTMSNALVEAGFFKGTAWDEPHRLVPLLVKGTMKSGHPASSFEIISDLRLLSYAKGEHSSDQISQKEAQTYIEEVIVHNLDLAFENPSEETLTEISQQELKKAFNLFGFIIKQVNLKRVYEKLVEEIKLICAQRLIVTRRVRELINLVNDRFDTSGDSETDRTARIYIDAIYSPSKGARKYNDPDSYGHFIHKCKKSALKEEAEAMGNSMQATGLVSSYHAVLLYKLVNDYPELVTDCLKLNDRGIAEWNKFQNLVSGLILETVSPHNCQFIYGLSRMLGKNLFSRRPIRVGLENLRKIKIHNKVADRIMKSIVQPNKKVSALQYLVGGAIKILGQPLGIGQGNNPTCQSARGISMWSQHSPAKLIDMIITVATRNNLIVRFEHHNLESIKLDKGLINNLDHNLDVVSVVLVPHLDKVYSEMMKRSAGRLEDPHKWVNPAMYGHWIQVGFASCYDYSTNAILDFEGFIKIFYAAFHPEYNEGHQMVYPNPVGLFITSNRGNMVGFHAISFLRVDKDPENNVRTYFLNPNNEGRQDWGQEIKPSVYGHGEKPGESSLPFHEFAARIYAFHYNPLDVTNFLSKVPDQEIEKVTHLAKNSWGKSYIWIQLTKIWA